jgi:putative nucleotidyltransferase with HDIG domain
VSFDTERLRKRVESLEGLPTLPSVANHLLSLTQSPQTSATQIGEIISQDQALTARVLKLVNSAYYGFPRQITTINHAVVILGFSRVKNIVLAASVFGMADQLSPPRFNASGFWVHSLGAAVASRTVARDLACGEAEEAFVCGLLHDIGKLVLAQVAPEDYDRCLAAADKRGEHIRIVEAEAFGVDHAEVGSWLVEQWKLPPAVVAAVRRHHTPTASRKNWESAYATHLADIAARALQIGWSGDRTISKIDPAVAAETGLSAARLDRLVRHLLDELDKAGDFFEMVGG